MAFCLPRLRAMRRYIAPSRVSVFAAVIAACPSPPRRYGLPLPVRPAGCSPDRPLRGVSRAHPRCPGVGNWEGSVPSSAMMARPLTAPIPVTSSSRQRARAGGCPGRRSRGRGRRRQAAAGAGRRCPGRRELLSDLLVQAVISALIASISRRCSAISVAWMSRNRRQRLLQLRLLALSRSRRARPAPPGTVPPHEASRNRAATPNSPRSPPRSSAARPPDLLHPPVPRLVLSQPSVRQHPQVPPPPHEYRRSMPRSFSLQCHTQSAVSLLPRPQVLTSRVTSHTSSPPPRQ